MKQKQGKWLLKQLEIGIIFATSMTLWSCLQPQLGVRFHIWLWPINVVKYQTIGAQMLKQLHHATWATVQHHTKPLALSYQDTSYSRVVMITCGGKGVNSGLQTQNRKSFDLWATPFLMQWFLWAFVWRTTTRVSLPVIILYKNQVLGLRPGQPQNPIRSGSWIPTFCSMFKLWYLQHFGTRSCKFTAPPSTAVEFAVFWHCAVAKLLL